MTTKNTHKLVIGRAELLHFLDIDVVDVPAKIDTGAYRCAVHADQIQLSPDGKTLSFRLFGSHPIVGHHAKVIKTDDFRRVNIENSFGHSEQRYDVKFNVQLGPQKINTSFTLADRSMKIYPILIGRKLLNKRFVVDTSLSSVDSVKLKQQFDYDFPKDDKGEDS
jgi:hypothetical protein